MPTTYISKTSMYLTTISEIQEVLEGRRPDVKKAIEMLGDLHSKLNSHGLSGPGSKPMSEAHRSALAASIRETATKKRDGEIFTLEGPEVDSIAVPGIERLAGALKKKVGTVRVMFSRGKGSFEATVKGCDVTVFRRGQFATGEELGHLVAQFEQKMRAL